MLAMTLQEAMARKGMSDADVAAALDVSREAVRLWRSNARRVAPTRVHEVARLLEIQPAEIRPDLFGGPRADAGGGGR